MVAEDESAVGLDEAEPGAEEMTAAADPFPPTPHRARRKGWSGIATDGPFAETKEVIAGYPRERPAGMLRGV